MRPGPPDDESDESDEAAFGFGIVVGIGGFWPTDGASMITSTAGRRPRRSIAPRSLRMKGISGAGRVRAGGRRAELAVGAATGDGACVVGAAAGDRAQERRCISIGGTVGAVVRSLIREDAPLIEHADMPTVTRAGTDGKGSSSAAGGSGEIGRRRTVKR